MFDLMIFRFVPSLEKFIGQKCEKKLLVFAYLNIQTHVYSKIAVSFLTSGSQSKASYLSGTFHLKQYWFTPQRWKYDRPKMLFSID